MSSYSRTDDALRVLIQRAIFAQQKETDTPAALHPEDDDLPEIMGNIMQLIRQDRETRERNIQLQTTLHVLSILKAEADQTFTNVKQTIYTMHDEAWNTLKDHQLPDSKAKA